MAHGSVGGQPLLHLPALSAIERDLHPRVVVQKSAQVGATYSLVHFCIWAADTGYAGRGNVLVLMPTQNQMADFSQQRFTACRFRTARTCAPERSLNRQAAKESIARA